MQVAEGWLTAGWLRIVGRAVTGDILLQGFFIQGASASLWVLLGLSCIGGSCRKSELDLAPALQMGAQATLSGFCDMLAHWEGRSPIRVRRPGSKIPRYRQMLYLLWSSQNASIHLRVECNFRIGRISIHERSCLLARAVPGLQLPQLGQQLDHSQSCLELAAESEIRGCPTSHRLAI